VNDLDSIYEELVHVKALSNLSSVVKKELAAVLLFEAHPYAGKTIFNQGDEGLSWYIILKGSVDVVVHGKNVVSQLFEGDDFGKLALVNKSPRAATIITREDNCHFLRVDKDDFNRILKDVEANTVRLKEHGKEVLVLDKIPINIKNGSDGTSQCSYKYSVTMGDPEKILEHLLETSIFKNDETADTFLEDFLMTYIVFLPVMKLCPALINYYKMLDQVNMPSSIENENMLTNRRKVIYFVKEWCGIAKDAFYEDSVIMKFLQELQGMLRADQKQYPSLKEDLKLIDLVIESDPYL
jgi:Rap guanine nucleotide exchange factor 4